MTSTADIIRGRWNQIKGQVKAKYGELTDDDLTYLEGKEDELIGRIQERTGRTKQEIAAFINSL